MVAKGHDFPDVTLGVVLDADATLRFPDFRAEERPFALVAQLAGRAGAGSAAGRVLVQTLSPDAPSDRPRRRARRRRLPGRRARPGARLLRYPPFAHLIRVVTSSVEPGAALTRRVGGGGALGVGPPVLLGPAPLFPPARAGSARRSC
jgi:primosomal protein N' (replication factor Y)